ncbi:MAG: methyltransferase domain-containing protein [Thaumarchaeota archaeon]|nr:methyltransferase domain-containing protein [Nitrososphaerota archaeon]
MTQQNLAYQFFNNTSSTYDKIVAWTTFGRDSFWKRKIIDEISDGGLFLDLGCGTGILTRKIAQKFPMAKIVGIDITLSYLKIAKKNSSSYKNIEFLYQDAEKLAFNSKFDCIVSSYIAKYCDPQILVKNSLDMLNPNGKIIIHDFVYPRNKTIQTLWNLYFVILNGIGNFIPEWKDAFSKLPKLIRLSAWLEKYEREMKLCGLDVKIHRHTGNCVAILIGVRRNT